METNSTYQYQFALTLVADYWTARFLQKLEHESNILPLHLEKMNFQQHEQSQIE